MRLRSRVRPVVTGAAAVVGVAVLVLGGRALFRPRETPLEVAPSGAARSDTAPGAPPLARVPVAAAQPVPSPLAALSDSLTDALQDYQGRAALFGAERTDCRSLATGLVTVEQRWLAYSVRRKNLGRLLDPARAAADSAFYAAMDSVESSYERSKCPRP